MPLFHRRESPPPRPDQTFDLHRTLPQIPRAGAAAPPIAAAAPGSRKRLFKRSLLVLLLVLIGVGGWLGWKAYDNSGKIFGGNLFGLFQTTKLKGETAGRVNILLMGYSADDPNHGGADLTDSIMVVSLDTVNHQVLLLSIPRDLYVAIPGHGSAKINEVYQDGERDQAGTGPALLGSVVETVTGLDMHYYALINYTAFRDTVDAVGGITVTIQSSDRRGLYDGNIAAADGGPLKLANGVQRIDGQTALNLARARGSTANSYGFAAGDFTRTEHQRMMLMALKTTIISSSTLSNPVKLSNLLDALGDNVKTDLTTAEARRLYTLASAVSEAQTISATINGDAKQVLLTSYRTATGQSALIPKAGLGDFSAIRQYVTQLTAGAAATP